MVALKFSRAGTQVQVLGLKLLAGIWYGMYGKNRRSSRGNGGFFIGFYKRPRDKGQQKGGKRTNEVESF